MLFILQIPLFYNTGGTG